MAMDWARAPAAHGPAETAARANICTLVVIGFPTQLPLLASQRNPGFHSGTARRRGASGRLVSVADWPCSLKFRGPAQKFTTEQTPAVGGKVDGSRGGMGARETVA